MALSLLDCVMTTLSMQDLQNPRNNFIKFHFFSPALCWHIRFFSRKRLTIWPHANRVIYAIAKVKLENEKRCDSRESRRCEIAYFCRSDRWQRIWSTIPLRWRGSGRPPRSDVGHSVRIGCIHVIYARVAPEIGFTATNHFSLWFLCKDAFKSE